MGQTEAVTRRANERAREALALHEQGLSLREIGERLGWVNDPGRPLSRQRARQLIERARRVAELSLEESR